MDCSLHLESCNPFESKAETAKRTCKSTRMICKVRPNSILASFKGWDTLWFEYIFIWGLKNNMKTNWSEDILKIRSWKLPKLANPKPMPVGTSMSSSTRAKSCFLCQLMQCCYVLLYAGLILGSKNYIGQCWEWRTGSKSWWLGHQKLFWLAVHLKTKVHGWVFWMGFGQTMSHVTQRIQYTVRPCDVLSSWGWRQNSETTQFHDWIFPTGH